MLFIKRLIVGTMAHMEKAASLREAAFMVELSGVEPLTSCMPCKRSTS